MPKKFSGQARASAPVKKLKKLHRYKSMAEILL
jgi:hypothetical protein